MLDIDLISEPAPQMYVSKVWESVWPEGAGRGRKRFIAGWGLRMSPGYRSKVEGRHFAHLWCDAH
jgi:hypothetical protein